MHYFSYCKRELFCEEIPLSHLAEKFGTPLYVYSKKTILEHFYKIKKAFSQIHPLICYSLKANSNLSILKLLVKNGAGLDIVSGGELFRARVINCPPKKIVYASVGKRNEEIEEAIDCGILLFNVESKRELERINLIAEKKKRKASVALRVNPEVKSFTHKYITTAEKTKFGIDIKTAKRIFSLKSNFPCINILGLHIHIGSQITKSTPFIKAIKKILPLIEEAKKAKINLRYFNIGGGLGIVYNRERPQTAEEFAKKTLPLLKKTGLKIILEPGRFIVGNAGVLLTRVLYIKDTPYKRFIIVDAAMNDLIRPALYGGYHKIVPVKKLQVTGYRLQVKKKADVVGPICESSDFLGKERNLNVKEGECLAVLGCGAYGFSMSSNYNSRPRAAEVLVDKDKVYLIRKRENYRDLIRKEVICEIL